MTNSDKFKLNLNMKYLKDKLKKNKEFESSLSDINSRFVRFDIFRFHIPI